jgi:hypothetical protein
VPLRRTASSRRPEDFHGIREASSIHDSVSQPMGYRSTAGMVHHVPLQLESSFG